MNHIFDNFAVLFIALLAVPPLIILGCVFVLVVKGLNGKPPPPVIAPTRTPKPASYSIRVCVSKQCGQRNPASANFCRRCGTTLAGRQIAA